MHSNIENKEFIKCKVSSLRKNMNLMHTVLKKKMNKILMFIFFVCLIIHRLMYTRRKGFLSRYVNTNGSFINIKKIIYKFTNMYNCMSTNIISIKLILIVLIFCCCVYVYANI